MIQSSMMMMMNAIVPIPRCELSIRPAALADYAFIDALQKKHNRMVGFFQRAALEGKIAAGNVLVAVGATLVSPSSGAKEGETSLAPTGYVIAEDRYRKREELGVIYQMNVVPSAQRKLVAASLLRAVFDRAAYGCKLFCCWCAQDLSANYFWESMGFIPLAFRTGAVGRSARGQTKTRTHIFWQRRVRQGDATTPYWFPSKTDGGMMRADRLILPIPPGVHWTDEMPVLLPSRGETCLALAAEGDTSVAPTKMRKPRIAPVRQAASTTGKLWFSPAKAVVEKASTTCTSSKPQKKKRQKVKADPLHIAAARELRDRYLEQFNAGVLADSNRVLPAGKYDVARQITGNAAAKVHLLPDAVAA